MKEHKKYYTELNEYDKANIKQLYYQNYTYNEISNILNYSIRSIRKVLIEDFQINTKLKKRYIIDSNYFDNINSEEKAYILGFIFADGFVGNDKFNNIVISSKDKEILKMIKEKMNFSGEIGINKSGGYTNSKESYVLNFSNKHMADKLRKFGICLNRKIKMKDFPSIPDDLIRHFLRGYFDGDGTIMKSKSITKKNNKIYQYDRLVFSMIASLDFIYSILKKFNIKHYSIQQSKTEKLYYLKIMAISEIYKLYHLLYDNSTIFLNRKRKIWDENIGAYDQK